MKRNFQNSNKLIGIDEPKSIMRKTAPTPLLVMNSSETRQTQGKAEWLLRLKEGRKNGDSPVVAVKCGPALISRLKGDAFLPTTPDEWGRETSDMLSLRDSFSPYSLSERRREEWKPPKPKTQNPNHTFKWGEHVGVLQWNSQHRYDMKGIENVRTRCPRSVLWAEEWRDSKARSSRETWQANTAQNALQVWRAADYLHYMK